jgi:hypothetical protein
MAYVFRPVWAIAAAAAITLLGGVASAQNGTADTARPPSLADQLASITDRLPLSGRRGPSLLRPGFAVGEYTGSSKSVGGSIAGLGFFRANSATANFDVKLPSTDQPVTGDCKGGQGEINVAFVSVVRDALNYVCSYAGGVPPGTELDLVESHSGGLVGDLLQPQRAGAFHYGDIHLRAVTQHISGIPFLGAHAVGYAITREDGVLVGGYQITDMGQPIFYLPKAPGAERDAVALLAVSLYAFRDPGGMW